MTEPGTEELALQSVKRIMLAFSGAYKKINLYSAGHGVYQDALSFFSKLLNESIERFGTIRLHVERDRILYAGEPVYKAAHEPTDLAFILHRDGILNIEFQNEPELWEIDTLLKVLHRHCVLGEDAEDDIATALWVLNLPSIAYEAAELELGLEEDLDFQELPCCPPGSNAEANTGKTTPFEKTSPNQPDHAAHASKGRDDFFQLSPNERKQLEKMITVEEEVDGSDYVVDVLLYIIENHALPEDLDDLLSHLTQSMQEAMLSLRFAYLHRLLGKLKEQIGTLKTVNHWSLPYLEGFCLKLSGKAFLDDLPSIASQIENLDLEATKSFKEFLLLLDASAITTLAPLMLQSSGERMQRILLETIARMAKRNFKPLENLLFSSDKQLAARLVHVLRFFSDNHSQQILSQLLRDKSEIIRRQALKASLARKDRHVESIFALVDDPDEAIRTLIIEHLLREQSEATEKLLLRYLNSGQSGAKNADQYLDICRALGRCNSNRALPFLKKLLFKWPRLGILRCGNSVQRRGAVIALKEMDTKEAGDMIDRAEQGFLKNFLRPA